MIEAKSIPVGDSREERQEIKWHVDDGIEIKVSLKNNDPYRGMDFYDIIPQYNSKGSTVLIVAYWKAETSFSSFRKKKLVAKFSITEEDKDVLGESLGDKVLGYLEGGKLASYSRMN